MMFVSLLLTAGCRQQSEPPAVMEKPKPPVSYKPQEMADALHSVIAADREVYARVVLPKLQSDEQLLKASANWKEEKASPLPAHMLKQASQLVQRNGAEFHYVVRSLSPINPRNAPETSVEKAGLEAVAANPKAAFYSEESLGGRRYFTAVYADIASVDACVSCHNQHKDSSRKDFKPGDVMGGIVVRVPLEF
jgi:hypothetical protein